MNDALTRELALRSAAATLEGMLEACPNESVNAALDEMGVEIDVIMEVEPYSDEQRQWELWIDRIVGALRWAAEADTATLVRTGDSRLFHPHRKRDL